MMEELEFLILYIGIGIAFSALIVLLIFVLINWIVESRKMKRENKIMKLDFAIWSISWILSNIIPMSELNSSVIPYVVMFLGYFIGAFLVMYLFAWRIEL